MTIRLRVKKKRKKKKRKSNNKNTGPAENQRLFPSLLDTIAGNVHIEPSSELLNLSWTLLILVISERSGELESRNNLLLRYKTTIFNLTDMFRQKVLPSSVQT